MRAYLARSNELPNICHWLLSYELIEPALPLIEPKSMMLHEPLLLFQLILLLR